MHRDLTFRQAPTSASSDLSSLLRGEPIDLTDENYCKLNGKHLTTYFPQVSMSHVANVYLLQGERKPVKAFFSDSSKDFNHQ